MKNYENGGVSFPTNRRKFEMLKHKINVTKIFIAFVVLGFVFVFISGASVVRATDIFNDEFIVAFTQGHWEEVENLLNKGADVNVRSNSGYTALIVATGTGNLEVIKSILEKGADPNAKQKDSMTPLMLATAYGNFKVAKFLLDNGADANVKDNAGRSVLDLASKKGNSEMLNLLKAHGAKE